MTGVFTKRLKEIDDLIIRGKYRNALKQLDIVYTDRKASKEDKIQCKIVKARIYLIIFPYSKAIKYAEEAYQESKEINNRLFMFDSVVLLPRAYFYAGEYKIKNEKSKLAIEILDSFEDKDSEEYLKRKARLPLLQGDRFNTCFPQIEESLSISEQLGDDILKADSYISLGSRHLWSGNLVKALDYSQKCLDLCESAGYHYGKVTILFQRGVIYSHKGELDLALDSFLQSYSMYEKEDLNPFFEACTFIDLGLIYWLRRDLQTSLEYYQKAITDYEKSKVLTTRHYPWGLLRMNIVLHEMGRTDEALRNLKTIEDLYNSQDLPIFNKIFFLAKAIYLKTKTDENSTKEAIMLLEEYVDDDITSLEINGLIVFHLCDLYLKEITQSNDFDIYEKLKHRIKKLNEMADNQNSYILVAQSLLLQSKLELIEFNIEQGQLLLENAQKIAEDKGITSLAKIISNEYDILLSQLSQWQEMSNYLPSLEDRFEFTHIEDFLVKLIKNNAIYIDFHDEREQSYFFLIMNKNGSVVFSEAFRNTTLDEELLQGLLVSINEITSSQELYGETIKRIRYQNYTIAISTQEDLFFVYTFVGQSYSALQKLRNFVNDFQLFIGEWKKYFEKFKTGKELSLYERMEISKCLEAVFVLLY